MKNKTIIFIVKSMMKEMVTFLDDTQKDLFIRMYHYGKPDYRKPINTLINDTIDDMDGNKLDHAFTQIENTLKK